MAERVLQGQPDIVLTLRRSARARRITLRISSLDGRVTLTLPRHVAEREALEFARQKEPWIRKHLDARVEDVCVARGTVLPVEGQGRTVVEGAGRSVRLGDETLAVPGAPDVVARRVQGFLKARARDVLAAACDDYAARLGRTYSGLSLRDTRSRWGSCSSAGRLMFSWRLILAPPEVLRYVAAHEVAHLAQMNHSPAFWAEVTRIHGPYDAQRRWLRTDGNALHRFRFGD
ncbi:SprT family zinc-dependent metalloprotease [Tateyamaria sp. ANG-S1]|uniref:M48 family metallopeptidase n=1 Tax=Tateyamaria sp. ANG-S1 TaxID=1577905 RepID=UPI00057EA728|nr:SprT family zinc-dependent metalloprotease [Tateyamaria sp. ANG-S1]KIC51844.1 zinc metalloprotease [Tateyamaria sp. ANG-S1]